MSKLKLSKQQIRRIQANKSNAEIRLNNQTLNDNENLGLLITRSSNKAIVKAPNGDLIHCNIRRNLSTLASGDKVIWLQEKDQSVITACCKRSTELSRPDKYGKVKVIAANIDQILIVCASLPAVSTLLLDSYLVGAHHLNIKPIIVFNKIDLEHNENIIFSYRKLGYIIIETSCYDHTSLKALLDVMSNKTNVFVGQSGVGKSSLINQLIPEASQHTQEISTQSKLGKHTTSHSYLYDLQNGGSIIDSPGIREFTLGNIGKNNIINAFPELSDLTSSCKFKNCTHTHEPSCAIQLALSTEKISKDRYKNLHNLLNS